MHIAICDDNIADRKQLERLLKRESERRASSTGIFYTDSFGNAPTLLANPMQYDVFYIDMCKTEGFTGVDTTLALIHQGVNSPIVMCCSDINYRTFSLPSNVLFLDKPINVKELSASIDHALSIKAKALPLIELREDKATVYVTEPDIVYAIEEGRSVKVYLTDKRIICLSSSCLNFFPQLENYPSFFAPSAKLILNGRHIEKLSFHKVTMIDGTSFKVAGKYMDYAKYAYETFHRELPIG